MPQLVGSRCRICGDQIVRADVARFCTDCHQPVHNICAGPTATDGTCHGCGAPAVEDLAGKEAEFDADFAISPEADTRGRSAGWLSFRGRASRSEYFTHSFISGMAFVAAMVLVGAAEALGAPGPVIALTGMLLVLVVGGWSEMAVTVRRLHDLDLPGWHWLLSIVPIYNMYLGAVLLLKPGTIGTNRYGPDPLAVSETMGDALLIQANRHERNGDWEAAFDAYREAAHRLKGQPNEQYAIECIRRLHETMSAG